MSDYPENSPFRRCPDVVVPKKNAKILYFSGAYVCDGIGCHENVSIVNEGPTTELPITKHQSSHKRKLMGCGFLSANKEIRRRGSLRQERQPDYLLDQQQE